MGVGAYQQPDVLEAQPRLVERTLELPHRAGLVESGVDQHDAVARGDGERVHVWNGGPRQGQPQAPEPGQEPVRPGELTRPRGHGSISTPGLRMPAGSTAALAARRAAANGSGRWRSYHGRWSRPTAWWCVTVPPAAAIASEAARFTSPQCSSSAPRRAGASTVK